MAEDTHRRITAMNEKIDQLVETSSSLPETDRNNFKAEMEGFKRLFSAFQQQKSSVIDWNKIMPPPEDMVANYSSLKSVSSEEAKKLLEKLAVLKLNGGLGTTMGCTGPKSVIEVRGEKSFLDLSVQQVQYLNTVHGTSVPLILMNSFNTHDATRKIISKYDGKVSVKTFNQSRHPRFYKDTLTPCPEAYDASKDNWYPPGHGDVFEALYNSKLIDELQREGIEYVFVSNVDNLGATVDLQILKHVVDTGCEYLMEVTDKTRADVKGGTLIQYEGKAKLLEIAQVPSSKVEEFKSIKKFKIFNTNNIWIKLSAIKRLVESGAFDNMDIIVNNKQLNGRGVIQLERAIGAGIQYFQNSHGVNVPRSRFLPVKSTSDLLIVQSNLYSITNGTLVMDSRRAFSSVPLVKLGVEFQKVAEYMKRFQSIPDILDLAHLTVSGDVTFGKDVVLKGTVIIVANQGSRIDIPSNSLLENKVISGNLRILDH